MRRTPGSRPRGPDRRAARRACAPCRTRRRPGRRGHGRGRGHARHGPCRRGRRGADGRPCDRGSRRGPRTARRARGHWPQPVPEQTCCRPLPASPACRSAQLEGRSSQSARSSPRPAERRSARHRQWRRSRGGACRRACGGASPRSGRTPRPRTSARRERGWSCRWCWGSRILSSSTAPYAADHHCPRGLMLARDQRCAREFVLWGATRRAARLSTDWCSFPSEHCPVVHNVCGSRAGGRPGAWRLGVKPAPVVRIKPYQVCILPSSAEAQAGMTGAPADRSDGCVSRRRASAWPRTCARRPPQGAAADPRARASRW